MTALRIREKRPIGTDMETTGFGVKWLLFLLTFFLSLFNYHYAVKGLSANSSEIVFGAREDTAPFAYKEGDDFKGYSVDLCYKIFEQYKHNKGDTDLKLKIIAVDASNRFEELKNKRIQILCGATTVTIERMKDHHFTLLTFLSGASVMKRRDARVEALTQPIDHEAVKVGVVVHTTTKELVERLLGVSVKMVPKDNHFAAFRALQRGEVDFYFGDRMILRERLRKAQDRDRFILAPGFLSYEPYAIAVQKDNHELLQAANAALANLYRSGEIKKIYHRWFGTGKMSSLLEAMYEIQKFPQGK
jgi:ABC-type amino acid transport substrate-binding protein